MVCRNHSNPKDPSLHSKASFSRQEMSPMLYSYWNQHYLCRASSDLPITPCLLHWLCYLKQWTISRTLFLYSQSCYSVSGYIWSSWYIIFTDLFFLYILYTVSLCRGNYNLLTERAHLLTHVMWSVITCHMHSIVRAHTNSWTNGR